MFSKTNKQNFEAQQSATPNKKGAPSVISSDLHILGNIISEGSIDIDGSIEGNIKAQQLTLRANGTIKGDIVAETVHVYGEVHGLIRAQSVHLYASCHVEGIIMHQSLTVEDGAFIDGKFKRFHGQVQQTEMPHDELGDDDGIIEDKPSSIPGNLRLIG